MNRHQRRRTRRIEHHGRAVRTQKIRQPTSSEVQRIPKRQVRVNIFWTPIRSSRQVIVQRRHTHKHRRLTITNHRSSNPRMLQRFPRNLQQQPLLRIHRNRLTRRQPEKLRIKLIRLPRRQKPPLTITNRARPRVIRTIKSIRIPTLRRHPHNARNPITQQLPILPRRTHPTRKPTTHPHHSNRLNITLPRQSPTATSNHQSCATPQ